MHQKAVIELFPKAPASQAFINIAKRLLNTQPQIDYGGVKLFWKKLLGVS
jgi:hypothetical protein